MGLSCDGNNRHLPPSDLVLDEVIDGVPLAGCATGDARLVRHQELQQYQQRRGQTQVPVRKRKGGSSSPVTTAALLEEQLPRPPTIVTIDEVWADRCCAQPPLPLLLCARLRPRARP